MVRPPWRGRIHIKLKKKKFIPNKHKFDRIRMVSIDTIGGWTVEFDLQNEGRIQPFDYSTSILHQGCQIRVAPLFGFCPKLGYSLNSLLIQLSGKSLYNPISAVILWQSALMGLQIFEFNSYEGGRGGLVIFALAWRPRVCDSTLLSV